MFVLQGTPEKLLDELVQGLLDDTFVKDFLLTYSTFLTTPTLILDRLRTEWEAGNYRSRVGEPDAAISNTER